MLADHWRRHADLMKPEDEDFVEAVAACQHISAYPLAMFDSFFRSGSLVFGGGHIV